MSTTFKCSCKGYSKNKYTIGNCIFGFNQPSSYLFMDENIGESFWEEEILEFYVLRLLKHEVYIKGNV